MKIKLKLFVYFFLSISVLFKIICSVFSNSPYIKLQVKSKLAIPLLYGDDGYTLSVYSKQKVVQLQKAYEIYEKSLPCWDMCLTVDFDAVENLSERIDYGKIGIVDHRRCVECFGQCQSIYSSLYSLVAVLFTKGFGFKQQH